MLRRLVLLLVIVGCGGRSRPPHKAGDVWFEGIRIEGNREITTDWLMPSLALQGTLEAGRPLDYYQLEIDKRRIRGAYLRLGYFDVDVKQRVERNDNALTAVFTVVEGRRSTTTVTIVDLPPEVPKERARELVELADGAPFDYDLYDDAKPELEGLVQDAGYPYVVIEASVVADRKRAVADVRYIIYPCGAPRPVAEGEAPPPAPPCHATRFGAIVIKGVEAYPDLKEAIENREAFAAGELYSASAIEKTQSALYEIGRFSAVAVEVDREKHGDAIPDSIPVTITVTPGTFHEIKLGGGVGYEPLTYELRTRVGGLLIPESHPLWTLVLDGRVAATVPHDNVSLDGAELKIRAFATAQRLDVIRPRWRSDATAGLDIITVEAYTWTGPLLRAGLSIPLADKLEVRLGWTFQLLTFSGISDFINTDAQASLGLDRVQRLGAFQQSIVADYRDNPLVPHKGWYAELRLSEGTRYAGGNLRFLEVVPDLRGYVPVGPIVLAARLRGGTILGDVPITERFFAGGAQSQRGFSERALAPIITGMAPDGTIGSVAVGGSSMLETGVEARIKLGEYKTVEFGTSLFIDGADVPNELYQLDPFDLHWAAGVGVNVQIKSAKIRIDVGHRLNRLDPGTTFYDNTAFHLGIGETF